MADDRPPSLSLDDVRNQFVDAEKRLRELGESIRGIDEASKSLDDARKAIEKTTTTLADHAVSLADLTKRLVAATEALERADPAGVTRRLVELDSKIAKLGAEHAKGVASVERVAGLARTNQNLLWVVLALEVIAVGFLVSLKLL